jgi:2-oxoglutarate dehydrogenase E1 component
MTRQDANAALARSSFLYGGNADYIEHLYSRFEENPGSLDREWQEFFQALKEDRAAVERAAHAPSWQRPDWPRMARDELSSALTGEWEDAEKVAGAKISARAQAGGVELSGAEVLQATRDSIRALMLIRAYRARGHFHANLDPLGLEPQRDEADLDLRSYGFTDADLDRKIFLDRVLGLEFGTLREILAIVQRT